MTSREPTVVPALFAGPDPSGHLTRDQLRRKVQEFQAQMGLTATDIKTFKGYGHTVMREVGVDKEHREAYTGHKILGGIPEGSDAYYGAVANSAQIETAGRLARFFRPALFPDEVDLAAMAWTQEAIDACPDEVQRRRMAFERMMADLIGQAERVEAGEPVPGAGQVPAASPEPTADLKRARWSACTHVGRTGEACARRIDAAPNRSGLCRYHFKLRWKLRRERQARAADVRPLEEPLPELPEGLATAPVPLFCRFCHAPLTQRTTGRRRTYCAPAADGSASECKTKFNKLPARERERRTRLALIAEHAYLTTGTGGAGVSPVGGTNE